MGRCHVAKIDLVRGPGTDGGAENQGLLLSAVEVPGARGNGDVGTGRERAQHRSVEDLAVAVAVAKRAPRDELRGDRRVPMTRIPEPGRNVKSVRERNGRLERDRF